MTTLMTTRTMDNQAVGWCWCSIMSRSVFLIVTLGNRANKFPM